VEFEVNIRVTFVLYIFRAWITFVLMFGKIWIIIFNSIQILFRFSWKIFTDY